MELSSLLPERRILLGVKSLTLRDATEEILGGNGTVIGASANVVTVEIARKNGAPTTFGLFFSYGMPVMLLTIAVSSVHVLFRYIF